MTWPLGIAAPATLWEIGERVSCTGFGLRPHRGTVKAHSSLYSVIIQTGPTSEVLVGTGGIDDAAERLKGHLDRLAEDALG